jgi:electron transport complex protein RnfB
MAVESLSAKRAQAATRLPSSSAAIAAQRTIGLVNAQVIARIDESACIGCTLCLTACPTAAIVGARGLMHTVVARLCTGCELCLPPCPVDCIALVEGVPATATTIVASTPRAPTQDVAKTTPRTQAERRAAVAAAFARARERRRRTRSPA